MSSLFAALTHITVWVIAIVFLELFKNINLGFDRSAAEMIFGDIRVQWVPKFAVVRAYLHIEEIATVNS